MTLLEVDDLIVRYGAVTALHGVSLRVEAGKAVAVVGPNGAGKTSLLRALSGLHRPAAGSAYFDGVSLVGRRAFRVARAGFVHVPEGRGIVAPLSVRENLMMGAPTVRGGEIAERIDEVLTLFPRLAERLDVSAGLISGGEQQMLAIGRGLISRPRLLAIDEPSMGLAPVIVEDVLAGLTNAMKGGMSILLVEQNVALAMDLADYLYLLVNGEIMASGAGEELPEDLLAAYVS
jgi:branched-chain amino acid transport system ATP-binding protein